MANKKSPAASMLERARQRRLLENKYKYIAPLAFDKRLLDAIKQYEELAHRITGIQGE